MGGKPVENEMHLQEVGGKNRSLGDNKGSGGSWRGMRAWVTIQYNFSLREFKSSLDSLTLSFLAGLLEVSRQTPSQEWTAHCSADSRSWES